ncbi:hypothetical protein CAEBREN_22722 [Caenorhabditis brenneri]|uniref:Uncharacterized protein n=1 Tax=Caenorhabditis brenneri TaxID=135651 RepID=G0MKF7_CAEBE|nr:hypothetical protein CAEBREN_22722 [Caenorhabditis brenneri]
MSTQIPMDPPKLFCLPARPLVCGLALFGAVRSFIQFWIARGITVGVSHICVLLLDLLLLFGAYKNDVFALKWSQRVTKKNLHEIVQLVHSFLVPTSVKAKQYLVHNLQAQEVKQSPVNYRLSHNLSVIFRVTYEPSLTIDDIYPGN